MNELPRNTVLIGDATTTLQRLPAASVDCVVTSPPYFGLRDYGTTGQIGLETTVTEWVDRLAAVGDQLARVLKPAGSWWLNVADTYSQHPRDGAPPKGLVLAPERLLLALAEAGWIVRNKAVWAKPHPMPMPAKDRLTASWEPFYLLVRSRHYYFDLDVIRVPHTSARRRPTSTRGPEPRGPGRPKRADWAGPRAGNQSGLARLRASGIPGHPLGKNPGDVWTIPQARNHGTGHHATYPQQLIARPILATCPAKTCGLCGRAWVREPSRAPGVLGNIVADCACNAHAIPGIVLDPFLGSGTTALVAQRLHRDWVGIELNPTFANTAQARIASEGHTAPLDE